MIKITLLIILFCVSGYLGFEFANVYKTKQDFFVDLLNFTKNLKNEISFMKTDILSILSKYQYKSAFCVYLSQYKELLMSKNYKRVDIDEIVEKISFLTEYEKNTISQMFFELGNVGYSEQLERLDYYVNIFNDLLENSKKSSDKMIPLCKKIGILTGALVCIVLI